MTTLYDDTMNRLRSGFGLCLPTRMVKHSPDRLPFMRLMKRAQRVSLDRSFVRAAVAASTLEPRILAQRMELIRSPWPISWFEWDEADRLSALEEVGYGADATKDLTEPPQAGEINWGAAAPQEPIRRFAIDARKWAKATGRRGGSLVCRVSCADEPTTTEDSAAYLLQSVTLFTDDDAKARSMLDIAGLGIAWSPGEFPDDWQRGGLRTALRAGLGPVYEHKTGEAFSSAHPLHGRLTCCFAGPFKGLHSAAFNRIGEKHGLEGLQANEFISMLCAGILGDWRFMAGVLLLWNIRGATLRTSTGERRPSVASGERLGDEHVVASIELPRPLRETSGRGAEGGRRSPAREHQVGEHWCHSHKNPGRKWLRRAHTRGHAGQGVITKEITAKAATLAAKP